MSWFSSLTIKCCVCPCVCVSVRWFHHFWIKHLNASSQGSDSDFKYLNTYSQDSDTELNI